MRLVNHKKILIHNKKQTLIVCFLLLVISSCSLFKSKSKNEALEIDKIKLSSMTNSDYIETYKLLDDYLKVTLNKGYQYPSGINQFYLKKIAHSIKASNELFFQNELNAQFVILKDERPFYFSLPPNKIFFSSGLLLKYIESESFLTAIISYELTRLEKQYYKKISPIPIGFVTIERLLSFLRLNSEEKVNIHQWAYHNLYRSVYFSDAYLSWIQVQNRKSLDFTLHLGEQDVISREESLFKTFLVKYNLSLALNKKNFEGSPREFYNFISEVERRAYEN